MTGDTADPQHPLPDLPAAAWLDIIRLLTLRGRFLAATVSTEWRELSLAALTQTELHVVLLNGERCRCRCRCRCCWCWCWCCLCW
jgi:hypothetical protein